MDFTPDTDQRAILDAVEALLERHAGVARAVALAATGAFDHALDEALASAGFLALATGSGTGPLEAALVVERVAAAGGVLDAAARLLVAPLLGEQALAGPIALACAGQPGAVRFAAHARSLLVLDDDADLARAVALETPSAIAAVDSVYGFPMGRVPAERLSEGRSLGAGSGARLRALWQLGLALEAVGAMESALACTTRYLSVRRQFGRPIGSFQAVAQRLSRRAIALEGSRWLAREAAFRDADPEACAVAAAYALEAAEETFRETHQLSGAIGFTREHALHVFSMRLQALRLELGGVGAHRVAATRARFGPAGPAQVQAARWA